MDKQKHTHCGRCGVSIKKRSHRTCRKCGKRLCYTCQRPENGVCYDCQPDYDDTPDGAYFALIEELGEI